MCFLLRLPTYKISRVHENREIGPEKAPPKTETKTETAVEEHSHSEKVGSEMEDATDDATDDATTVTCWNEPQVERPKAEHDGRVWTFVVTCALVAVCTAVLPALAQAQGVGRGSVEHPVQTWPVADPDTMGVNLDALADHLARCKESGASSCLVAYKGYIIQKWYRPGQFTQGMSTASAVKSWTGLLTGMLLADGKIGSVDDSVATYLPEWTAGAEAGVTIRHLLTMTSGLRDHTGSEMTMPPVDTPHDVDSLHPGVVAKKNTTGYVLDLPLDFPPGERFSYSNEGVQLLSPILKRAAGMPVAQYARERLFAPLGMDSTRFMLDEYANTVTFGGARTTLQDFAKIGQLMLNDGQWNGQQIVPASWVERSTTPSALMKNYGFLWWMDPERSNFAATGDLDRVCIVFPERGLVAARLQGAPAPDATVRYQSVETLELLQSIVDTTSTQP